MKKVKAAIAAIPAGWRLPLIVSGIHILAILLFAVFSSSEPREARPEGVRVSLAALPRSAQVAAQPKPTAPSKPDTAPAKPSKPTKPTQKSWKARSAEDIRRELESETQPTPSPSPERNPQPSNTDLQKLVDDFSKAAHATSVIGEPVAVPDNYAAQIRQIIYDTWNQPTKAEVPTASQFVGIRLEIQADGRVSSGTITQRSKSLIMNQSVKALLNALKKFPPLPENYAEDQLRLDIVLRLE